MEKLTQDQREINQLKETKELKVNKTTMMKIQTLDTFGNGTRAMNKW